MASQVPFKIGLFILSFIFFTRNATVTSIPAEELDAMLSIVRARGYNLFTNAITTSDLQLDLLTAADSASFTFFAPTDSSLFALAMTLSAPAYTATLRYHGLPRRLSVSDLNRLPSQVPIPTLLPSQNVSLTRRRRGSRSDGAIFVNGVSVVLPGLFYGSHVAVHGLAGILVLHSHVEFLYDSPPSPFFPFTPQIGRDSKENLGLAAPPVDREIGSPAVSPSGFLNKSVDLAANRVFLGPAPERLHLQVQSPPVSSVSPSASPVLPSPDESDYTPPMHSEHSVTLPPPVLRDLTPPMRNETLATPPPPVSTSPKRSEISVMPPPLVSGDLTPPMRNETSMTPPPPALIDLTPPITSDLTPPMQNVISVTPPPSVSSDLTPPMQDENSVTPPVPVSSDLTPPMQDENSVTPPPPVSSDLTLPMQNETSVTLPPPVSSDLTSPMQDVNSVTQPLPVSSDMSPPMQDMNSLAPPPPVSSDLTPPLQDVNSVAPPPPISSDMTSPIQDENSVTPPPPVPSDLTPPMQDVDSMMPPPVSSDLTPPMQNNDSETPQPVGGGEDDGETPWVTKPEGDLSGRTVKEDEPSDWMNFRLSDGNSNHVHVEDSHFTPNMLQRV